MTARRDTDRSIAAFLADGPGELSPRLAEAIRHDVRRTRQRALRRPWRMPPVPRSVFIVVPLAALALLLGALAIGGGSTPATPPSTPVVPSAPAVAPPATAIPTASPASPGPVLPIGDGEPWYVYEGGMYFVSVTRPDGTGTTSLPLDGADWYGTPDWSPDGSRLVMERGIDPASQVWIVNADGSAGTGLTPLDDRCAPLCPRIGWTRWSPDGRSILFVRDLTDTGRTVESSLEIVDVETQAIRTVYTSTESQLLAPAWAPDGTHVVLEVRTATGSTPTNVGAVSVAVIDLESTDPVPVPLANAPDLAGRPDWSPDGSLIVVRTNPLIDGVALDPLAGTAIWLVPVDGGPARSVLEQPADGPAIRGTSWTPDGSAILYQLQDRVTRVQTLRMVDADGSNDRLATGNVVIEGGEARLRP
jgi:Tol biopolymer transport system component